MKKAIAILLALVCLLLAGCASNEGTDTKDTSGGGEINETANVRLTFAESINMDKIKELSGRTVEMVGYMATISPVNGEYLYLMNLPYQSCPYCVPNTQQLSNTIAVYAKDGDRFDFTDGPINVIGVLETGDFEDEYGYTYTYRIKDAIYTEVNSTEASEKLALWERITNANIASDVYSMYDFISFECNWPNYIGHFQEGDAYLYPADVEYFEKNQYKIESISSYFDALVKEIQTIDDDVMNELVEIVRDAEKLVGTAVDERNNKNYTYDSAQDKYSMIAGEELMAKAQESYNKYAYWLENFSLSN